ncbi:hypothetical protein RM704_35495 [Streptomyces sp. DSM 3412]|uniref:Uncharacterized protein n=1 Tax=Streptomyces gottesmaniae TaxID=3075518 RepID=A0ABU2Z7Z1_9ACTN|nr:hypothetical protein [Streptomyces sp. DSM 3412]MDT0572710.1 hypothetical protein [Streptomyces sp. DSM 3412]
MEQVLSDLRYAAKNVGEDHLRVVEDPRAAAAKVPPCMATGAILTPEIPGRAELTLITHRLRTRGWKLHGALDVELTMLSSGKWDIMLGAGPVPEEIAAQAGDSKGGFGISVTGVCKKPS